MIAVDTNILVNFQREDYSFHKKAVAVITSLAESNQRWAIPWPCIHEFYAIITNPRIFKIPTSPNNAIMVIESICESPSLTVLAEGSNHLKLLNEFLLIGKVTGGMVHDALYISNFFGQHFCESLYTPTIKGNWVRTLNHSLANQEGLLIQQFLSA